MSAMLASYLPSKPAKPTKKKKMLNTISRTEQTRIGSAMVYFSEVSNAVALNQWHPGSFQASSGDVQGQARQQGEDEVK